VFFFLAPYFFVSPVARFPSEPSISFKYGTRRVPPYDSPLPPDDQVRFVSR